MPDISSELDTIHATVSSLFLEGAADSLADTSESIYQLFLNAFDAPVNYPPLAECTVPGDRITVLLQPELPAPDLILQSLVRALSSRGIETEGLHVVVSESTKAELGLRQGTEATTKDDFTFWFDPSKKLGLRFVVHDSHDEHAVAYLAANEQGNPVYVNRLLHESDLVIPIHCPGPNGVTGDCLYPTFSSDETIQRFQKKTDSAKQREAEITLANDALGIFFSVDLIGGPGGAIADVVCGERKQTLELAIERANDFWTFTAPDDCDMVVATIESGSTSTTWKDIVSAVNSAAQLTVGDGPIIVWSNLGEKPKAKVREACLAQFEGTISSKLPTQLQHFASILAERQVFLKSRLTGDTVEGLGLGHIQSADEVTRIAGAFSCPALVRDGHLRVVPERQPEEL